MPRPSLSDAAEAVTLATVAYRRLRDDILDCRLPPGAKLKVQHLADHYGIGPAPLREALSRLVSEGLVERVEQRGFRVAAADPQDLAGLVRTRCLVEPLALKESVRRGAADWEDRVTAAAGRLARLPRFLDPTARTANPAWEEAHRAFHHALISACDAPPLLELCTRLREAADRYRALATTVSYPGRDVAAEHAAIAEAALARDADRAAALLAEHLAATGRFVTLALARRIEPGEAAVRRTRSAASSLGRSVAAPRRRPRDGLA
ncbi:GntR family transcriptional regulator [Elioraea thermophila]|uniref:GntR family transcriptional regulator n=1 Tax=Elioraea thermophila TaxID=2185104 RepID=UPI000DF3F409|nr:FCD domain-containing protein [Elioraea thermophila]